VLDPLVERVDEAGHVQDGPRVWRVALERGSEAEIDRLPGPGAQRFTCEAGRQPCDRPGPVARAKVLREGGQALRELVRIILAHHHRKDRVVGRGDRETAWQDVRTVRAVDAHDAPSPREGKGQGKNAPRCERDPTCAHRLLDDERIIYARTALR